MPSNAGAVTINPVATYTVAAATTTGDAANGATATITADKDMAAAGKIVTYTIKITHVATADDTLTVAEVGGETLGTGTDNGAKLTWASAVLTVDTTAEVDDTTTFTITAGATNTPSFTWS